MFWVTEFSVTLFNLNSSHPAWARCCKSYTSKVGNIKLKDTKLAILTGAAGEVGKASARQFSDEGWSLLLCDQSEDVVVQAEALAKEFDRTCLGIKMDLSIDAEIERVTSIASDLNIPVRFLGLIAAVNQKAFAIEDMKSMETWDWLMSINLRANVKFIAETVPMLRKAGGASIVTVSSYWGREGHPYFSAYCASKSSTDITDTECSCRTGTRHQSQFRGTG